MTVVAHDEAQSLKARIFSAAIAVFAEHGLSGARMEQIATEAQTTKRMVVYYFKSKEQLYQEVPVSYTHLLHGGLNIGCRCCHSQRPHDSETARLTGNLLIMCKRIFIMG